jgi:hypothetical protein
VVKVYLTYFKDGKLQERVPAQEWIIDPKTKKAMPHDWVFGGRKFMAFPDAQEGEPEYYCANNGEVISIANFAFSMLDLPVKSSREAAELGFVANTDRIPGRKTKVLVTMEVGKK